MQADNLSLARMRNVVRKVTALRGCNTQTFQFFDRYSDSALPSHGGPNAPKQRL